MYPGLTTVTLMSYCSTSARRQSKKAWVACLEAASEKQEKDCALRRRSKSEGGFTPLNVFLTAVQPLLSNNPAAALQLLGGFCLVFVFVFLVNGSNR